MSVKKIIRNNTVAIILVVYAVFVVLSSSARKPDPPDEWYMPLSLLYKRAQVLEKLNDPIKQDSFCIPLSASCRSFAKQLSPDSKVFIDGILGEGEGKHGGYYFFMNYYLYPVVVDISVDQDAVKPKYWRSGKEYSSPEELVSLGYTHLLRIDQNGRVSVAGLRRPANQSMQR